MIHKRATIIYNPMSGRPARREENVQRMIGLLGKRGVEAETRATTGPDDAAPLAHEAAAAGADIIIAYGGDGTLNEVIQGMAKSDAALAVWPGGTANVIARDLGVPFNIEGLADMIAGGKTKRIALGLAKRGDGETGRVGEGATSGERATGGPGEGATVAPSPRLPVSPSPCLPVAPSRYFLMMAGIGLDASIARGVNKKLKRRTGEFAYWLSGVKHLFLWRGEPFTIEVDGRCYESAFALVGNGKGYGGGLMMTPGAKLDEPWFEIYILPPRRNNFAYLSALRGCMRGTPEVGGGLLVKGEHVKANSAHEPWVEADGEIIGPLPMTFDAVPHALSIIVP